MVEHGAGIGREVSRVDRHGVVEVLDVLVNKAVKQLLAVTAVHIEPLPGCCSAHRQSF
jgi:hypothetical protein